MLYLMGLVKEMGSHILIEQSVLDIMNRHRQRTTDAHEAGGILLGFRRGQHLHIVEASSPKLGDKSSRFSFDRQDPEHQRLARQKWLMSKGMIDYLGEWHTHPANTASPSIIDKEEWMKLLRIVKKPLAFVIADSSDSYWLGLGIHKQLIRAHQYEPAC